MGCASSAMEAVNELAAKFKENDVVTAEELLVPELGLRYSKDYGSPFAVAAATANAQHGTPPPGNPGGGDEGEGADDANSDEAVSESATAATTVRGSGMSLYSTVLTTQMVAKTMAQRREELINSFNAIVNEAVSEAIPEETQTSFDDLSDPTKTVTVADFQNSVLVEMGQSAEKESLTEMELEEDKIEDALPPPKPEVEEVKTEVEKLSDQKPDVVAAIDDEQVSLETKLQQEKAQEANNNSAGKEEVQPEEESKGETVIPTNQENAANAESAAAT